jgi:activator of HSP90 ATPase
MTKTITQKVVFKNTTPKALYDLYMDAKKHALICGAECKISPKEGAAYSVYGGYATGKNLQLVKDKLIVQSWRAADWNKNEMDSTFIINLEEKGNDVVLHAIHANLPDSEAESISQGWHDFYWKPWKQYLTGKTVTRPEM